MDKLLFYSPNFTFVHYVTFHSSFFWMSAESCDTIFCFLSSGNVLVQEEVEKLVDATDVTSGGSDRT